MKDNEELEKICTTLKDFRELKKITREHVAGELNMSVSGYSKIERGEVDITLKKLIQMCEILDVSVSQLLAFDTKDIFRYSHSNVQTHNAKSEMNVYADTYLAKYVNLLEEEVNRLKNRYEV